MRSPLSDHVYKHLQASPYYLVFYTDASRTAPGNYVGFAVYSPTLHIQLLFRISSYSSIFTAEALAIHYALNYILSYSFHQSVIFTDSKSVTEALISFNFDHLYNYIIPSIRQKLYEN